MKYQYLQQKKYIQSICDRNIVSATETFNGKIGSASEKIELKKMQGRHTNIQNKWQVADLYGRKHWSPVGDNIWGLISTLPTLPTL